MDQQPGEAFAVTLRVSAGEEVDVISFDPENSHDAGIVVDLEGIGSVEGR
jgi:hypothetical protein